MRFQLDNWGTIVGAFVVGIIVFGILGLIVTHGINSDKPAAVDTGLLIAIWALLGGNLTLQFMLYGLHLRKYQSRDSQRRPDFPRPPFSDSRGSREPRRDFPRRDESRPDRPPREPGSDSRPRSEGDRGGRDRNDRGNRRDRPDRGGRDRNDRGRPPRREGGYNASSTPDTLSGESTALETPLSDPFDLDGDSTPMVNVETTNNETENTGASEASEASETLETPETTGSETPAYGRTKRHRSGR